MSLAYAVPSSRLKAVTLAEAKLPPGIHLNTTAPDIEIAKITIRPGGSLGWHSHGGPVLITIAHGTLTDYTASRDRCVRAQLATGEAFAEKPGRIHTLRNEGKRDLVAYTVTNHGKGHPPVVAEQRPPKCKV